MHSQPAVIASTAEGSMSRSVDPGSAIARSSFISLLAMMLGVSLAGCGGPQSDKELVRVSGTVTYAGEPLADAIVAFDSAEHEDASPGTGVTDDEGNYSLKRSANEVGVPHGRYRVTITAWDSPLEMP